MKYIKNKLHYSMQESYEYLGITRPTLQKLIKNKKIKALDIGSGDQKVYFIDLEVLDNFAKI